MLSEKIDRVETRLDKRMDCLEHKLDAVAAETSGNTAAIRSLSAKLDAVVADLSEMRATGEYTAPKLDGVAADLSAHSQDTEAHLTIYKVKEGI